MKLHNITVIEERDTEWMYVPHGNYFVCIGKKDEVVGETAAELGKRVLECLVVAEYHTITQRHRRSVH